MKRFLVGCAIFVLALSVASETEGQTAAAAAGGQTPTASAATQSRVVGEVTAIDASARTVTIKTAEGRLVVAAMDERSNIVRVPPGETSAEKAVKISLADITVGDRVFARGQVAADGASVTARQIVVTGRVAASTGAQAGAGDDWNRRGIAGRIAALNPATKEITLRARGREGAEGVVVDASSGKVKFLRYAPDSVNAADAVASSFADLKVGDQLRARGERNADGTRFTPEEIIFGSFVRVGGTVTSVNVATGEIAIQSEQMGTPLTVSIGQRTTLRRVTPEIAATITEQRQQRRAPEGQRGDDENRRARREAREARGEGGGRRGGGGGGGGRNFQEMLANLPLIKLADLKKGDVVFVTATPGADASRATAITLLTGEAEFMKRLQRFQGRPNRDGQNMSPGLPGDVLGGGNTGTNDRPQP
ncbi:MAG TPA: hypothetical protein VF666_18720 [Pyrinomonadaceae bacterium]